MNELVDGFTQEKALVGAFSVIVKTLFPSLFSTDRGGGVDQQGCEGCVGGVDLALVRLQHPVVARGGEAGLHQGVAGHCLLSLPGHGPIHTRVLCIIVSQIQGGNLFNFLIKSRLTENTTFRCPH